YKSLNLSILWIVLLSFFSSIIFVIVYVFLLYSRLKKEFMLDISKIKEQQYIVDEDRISILVEGRKTDILYKDLKKIKESKNFFILNHKADVMIAIPKRFIKDTDIPFIKEIFDRVKLK
ncbi:MAG: YcxB family protein, partial [Spirochaetota bacterium]